jgi:hypothetical protein
MQVRISAAALANGSGSLASLAAMLLGTMSFLLWVVFPEHPKSGACCTMAKSGSALMIAGAVGDLMATKDRVE